MQCKESLSKSDLFFIKTPGLKSSHIKGAIGKAADISNIS